MLLRILIILLIFLPIIMLLPRWLTMRQAGPVMFSVSQAAEAANAPRTAIVFGAGLWRDGRPAPVLADRVETAVELYQTGKVDRLLMSGGRASQYYDEPGAMRRYALNLGVPDEAIVLDYAGLRSYDTCYRARHTFGLQQAVLITQRFHLPRALFLCQAMGVESVGVIADRREYRRSSALFWDLREIAATWSAVVDVYITRPIPDLSISMPFPPPEAQ